MLRITNGGNTLMVTRGAFNGFYKARGFHIVEATESPEKGTGVSIHPEPENGHSGQPSQLKMGRKAVEEEEGEEEELDLSEIPLGEMTFDQLEEYADELEIDHDGVRSKKELRALIREHLNK